MKTDYENYLEVYNKIEEIAEEIRKMRFGDKGNISNIVCDDTYIWITVSIYIASDRTDREYFSFPPMYLVNYQWRNVELEKIKGEK